MNHDPFGDEKLWEVLVGAAFWAVMLGGFGLLLAFLLRSHG